MVKLIYKICSRSMWDEAVAKGEFTGAPVDLADGFIHFSTAEQVKETAAKHFRGQTDLVLLSIDEALLGPELKYEVSRGGALFPHLFAPLSCSAVVAVSPLPLDADGSHIFPVL